MTLNFKSNFLFLILFICSCTHNISNEQERINYKKISHDTIFDKDSITFRKVDYLNIVYTDIKSNSNVILSDSLLKLDVSYSSYIDTLMKVKKMNNIEVAYFINNKFGVVIDDTLSVRKLTLSYNDNDEMDKYYSYIDVEKLPKLESLNVHCKRCEIEIPNKDLKYMHIKTSKIDTFYKDTSLFHHTIPKK